MATRQPLVIVNGQVQQLQAGDQINAATAITDTRTVSNGEASAALPFGTPVYVSGPGTVKRAQANAGPTSKVLGLIYDASIASGASGQVAVNGILVGTTAQWDVVTGGTGGLTPNATYYLDPGAPGKLTTTAPVTTGQYVQPVGIGVSATEFEVNEGLNVLL